jgi:redox-sensitive bicupin YhaK (pirin superfamily)
VITIRRAGERGHAQHDWLDSYHTFSFAGYHDPAFMGFRSLRVINEDRVRGGEGFGTHSHRDFEIISYVISGELKHEDSLGHSAVMKPGDIQRISAGTGISHSEFNNSATQQVHFLQIWITPSSNGVRPGYAEQSFADVATGKLTLACSGDGRDGSIAINQDADLFIGRLHSGDSLEYPLPAQRYGWVQLIDGELNVNGTVLHPGDAIAVEDEAGLSFSTEQSAHFLVFDLN